MSEISKDHKFRDTTKVPNFISLPNCAACGHNRGVKEMKNGWFGCSCGSMWVDYSFAKSKSESKTCPECRQPCEIDFWEMYYPTGHYSFNTEQKRGCFHEKCYREYYRRVSKEEDELKKDITDGEIVSQLVCPKCGKRELYFYPDSRENRPHYAGRIYQCMACDTTVNPETIEATIKNVRLRRHNGGCVETTCLS
jgi:predicted RNA-binding Zn-ribbon protein involved in translation (DUF1610 family)